MTQPFLDKLPGMSDSDLANLFANATRLNATGTPKQRTAATELLPALEAETQARVQAKLDAQAAKKAARPKTRKKAAPKDEPAGEAEA